MYQSLLADASFYDFLLRLDEDRAEEIRASGCDCGGRLHQAHYQRKPRGGPAELSRDVCRRLSYCCSVEGCRRRQTPPSLRFLSRKVFFAVVVLLVPVLREGPKPKRLRRLQEAYEISPRTVRRWQRWWREEFSGSQEMTRLRGSSTRPMRDEDLPGSLLEMLVPLPVPERVLAVLRALSPPPTVQAG